MKKIWLLILFLVCFISICFADDEQFVYNTTQFAEKIGMHPNVLRQLCVHGEIPSVKIRNEYYVTRDNLERFFSGTNTSQYDYEQDVNNINVSSRSSSFSESVSKIKNKVVVK